VPLCPPTVSTEYFKLALAALQHERPIHAEAVHHALADAMKCGMESIPKNLAHSLRRQMGTLLTPPEPQQQSIRMTPVARAVKELIIRIERSGESTS